MPHKVRSPSTAEQQAIFDLFLAAFRYVASIYPGPSGVYNFGPFRVQINFSGSGLASVLLPAIAHNALPDGENPAYQIFAWDSASTGCELPLILARHVQILKREWASYLDSRGSVAHLSGDKILTTLHLGAAGVSLSLYHSCLRQAIYWSEDAGTVPYYEQGAPFRTILHWMVDDNHHLLLHAGAVGLPKAGVLLVGKGGSGKSTSTLACLDAGLKYISDDYCLVSLDEPLTVYSLYNTAKLVNLSDLARFPALANGFEYHDSLDPKSKPMIFLNQYLPQQIINSMPLRAILIQNFTGQKHTYLRPASSAAALAAIAPNTIFQLPGSGRRTMTAISRLAQRLPCLWFDAGINLDEIPQAITAFLEKAPEDK
jgi:hypothetical protein